MPTSIIRQPTRPVLFFAFVAALFAAAVLIEFADPAPMTLEAATVASP